MKPNQPNGLLLIGILAGLFSLPMHWARLPPGYSMYHTISVGDELKSMSGDKSISVTGLNGYFTTPAGTPIWLVVTFCIGASIMQPVRFSKAFKIPWFVVWGAAILSILWLTIPFLTFPRGIGFEIGIGFFFGFVCAATPFVSLLCSREKPKPLESRAAETDRGDEQGDAPKNSVG
jgi:hypothetical protein